MQTCGSSEASPSKRKRESEISTTSGNTQNKTTPVTEISCCNLNEMIIEDLREGNSKLETAHKESLAENVTKDDTIQSLNARIVMLEQMFKESLAENVTKDNTIQSLNAKIVILEQMLNNANISSDMGNQNNDTERCNNNEDHLDLNDQPPLQDFMEMMASLQQTPVPSGDELTPSEAGFGFGFGSVETPDLREKLNKSRQNRDTQEGEERDLSEVLKQSQWDREKREDQLRRQRSLIDAIETAPPRKTHEPSEGDPTPNETAPVTEADTDIEKEPRYTDGNLAHQSSTPTSENSTVLHAPDMLAADLDEINEVVETTEESDKLNQQSTLNSNELATCNNTFSATEPALGKK